MTRTLWSLPASVALSTIILLIVAAPAAAMNCSDWTRLGPDQKGIAVDRMIQDAIAGNRGRQYDVSRGEIERCLYRSSRNIEYAFDDACADSQTAGMGALRRIFKDYIWSCVG